MDQNKEDLVKSENTSGMPRVHLEAPKNISPEASNQINALNEIFLTISIIDQWAKKEDKKQTNNKLVQNIWHESSTLFEMVRDPKKYQEFGTDKRSIGKTFTDLHDKNEAATQVLLGKNLSEFDPKKVTVKLKESEELTLLMAKIPEVLHDIGNPLTKVILYLDLGEQDFAPEIHNVSQILLEVMSAQFGLLSNEYPHEEIPLRRLEGYIENSLSGLKTSSTTVDIETIKNIGSLNWSRAWLSTLVENISQNAGKSYVAKQVAKEKDWKPVMQVKFEQETIENNNFLAIIFQDNGVGFPQEIIENGFKTGFTSWPTEEVKGTGIGMAAQQEAIKQYGGTITPENIYDNDQIVGSKLTVRLPVNMS